MSKFLRFHTPGGGRNDVLKELTFRAKDGGPVEVNQLIGLLLEAQDTIGPRASIYAAKVDGFVLKLVVEPQE